LDEKKIQYNTCDDINLMLSKGIRSVPVLEVDGEALDYFIRVKNINNSMKKLGVPYDKNITWRENDKWYYRLKYEYSIIGYKYDKSISYEENNILYQEKCQNEIKLSKENLFNNKNTIENDEVTKCLRILNFCDVQLTHKELEMLSKYFNNIDVMLFFEKIGYKKIVQDCKKFIVIEKANKLRDCIYKDEIEVLSRINNFILYEEKRKICSF
jgi:hypothetical protein